MLIYNEGINRDVPERDLNKWLEAGYVVVETKKPEEKQKAKTKK